MTHISAPLPAARSFFARLRTLHRDNRGLAMIETAFTMPTLIFAGLAGLEVANLMITHTRVSGIALSAADNASRIASGSNLALPQVREIDVNDVFNGAQLQGGNLNVQTHGRIVLTSLETNADGGQWIHWQRCFGAKNWGSNYGIQGTGATGTGFAGMGPAGREVKATLGSPVMFVEVFYEYQPFMFDSWIGSKRIDYEAAFTVRDPRDTSNIFNPSPAATVNGCNGAPPPPPDDDDDGNNGHGDDDDGDDDSNPGGGGG
jgi:hypothetical protein